MKIHNFLQKKQQNQPISMITCYDYAFAKIIDTTDIDCVLVGDSLSMVVHGCTDTTQATMEMMVLHTRAVARGITKKFIISDLPFLSYRKSLADTMQNVQQLIQAGAHSVKLEGTEGNLELITHLNQSGVPVMGHLGLTPQFIHQLGGYKVQGRATEQAEYLCTQALQLEEAGCYAIVLECVPWKVAQQISNKLSIPTIGIGAGPYTDGQVLVLHDMLGLQQDLKTKFSKQFTHSYTDCMTAINTYAAEVKARQFPTLTEHSFE